MGKIISVHVRESKSALDFDRGFFVSGTWTPDSRFLELCTGLQSPRFRISQQKYAALRIPQAEISRIPEQGSPLHLGRTVQSINGIVITHLLCTFCSSCHRERKKLCPEIPLRSQHLDHVWLSFPQFFQADLNGS